MHSWHFDDKRKQVVDKRIERFVHESLPRQMSYRFHLFSFDES